MSCCLRALVLAKSSYSIKIKTERQVAKKDNIIWQQQCRVYVNFMTVSRANAVHSQHPVSVLFIVMYSSLHHSFI